MKNPLAIIGLVSLLSTTALLDTTSPVLAGNSSVEAALQSFGDTSVFYQALLNTGVINELNEDEHYTIFAPTNAAFAQIGPNTYPCFYAVQCRPQIAAILRNHIIVGNYDLAQLTSYGYGIKADGGGRLHVEQAYVNDYTVNGHKILSMGRLDGNVIFRIDGVIAKPQELSQFTTTAYTPSAYSPSATVTERTITQKIYYPPSTHGAYPAGTMAPASSVDNNGAETTIIQTYTTEQPY